MSPISASSSSRRRGAARPRHRGTPPAGDPALFAAQLRAFGSWAGPDAQPLLARRFLDIAPTEGVRATRAGCEVLVARFTADADRLLPAPGGPDLLAAVAAAEPQPVALVGPDGVAELCRASAVVVDLEGRHLLGHSAHVAALADRAGELAGHPGCRLTVDETLVDGDRLSCRFTLTGRHDGESLGMPATGRVVVLPGIAVRHVRDDACVRCWSSADMLGVLVQIGALPPPA